MILRLRSIVLALGLLLSVPCSASTFIDTPYTVCFTPGGDCTDEIVDAINSAKQSILVQAYSFTSKPIASALVNAKKRGVDVYVILDKSQAKGKHYSSSTFLLHYGIPVWIDNKVAIAHNKVMIIDNSEVITGSFNFTAAAQKKNAENLLIIRDKLLAQDYLTNWNNRKNFSYTLQPNNIF
jgi:phosphatidylserine/phosphatidylglycerophosphate/cardiolipin synthase-like enzyme